MEGISTYVHLLKLSRNKSPWQKLREHVLHVHVVAAAVRVNRAFQDVSRALLERIGWQLFFCKQRQLYDCSTKAFGARTHAPRRQRRRRVRAHAIRAYVSCKLSSPARRRRSCQLDSSVRSALRTILHVRPSDFIKRWLCVKNGRPADRVPRKVPVRPVRSIACPSPPDCPAAPLTRSPPTGLGHLRICFTDHTLNPLSICMNVV